MYVKNYLYTFVWPYSVQIVFNVHNPVKLKILTVNNYNFLSMHWYNKQEAQGACGAHLVLTNPLGFVGFFFSTNKILYYLALAVMEKQFKIPYLCKCELYCLKGCTLSNVNASRAVIYNNKIILKFAIYFFILHIFDNLLG